MMPGAAAITAPSDRLDAWLESTRMLPLKETTSRVSGRLKSPSLIFFNFLYGQPTWTVLPCKLSKLFQANTTTFEQRLDFKSSFFLGFWIFFFFRSDVFSSRLGFGKGTKGDGTMQLGSQGENVLRIAWRKTSNSKITNEKHGEGFDSDCALKLLVRGKAEVFGPNQSLEYVHAMFGSCAT